MISRAKGDALQLVFGARAFYRYDLRGTDEHAASRDVKCSESNLLGTRETSHSASVRGSIGGHTLGIFLTLGLGTFGG